MKVAILKNENLQYSNTPPFSPSTSYPEYPFKDVQPHNAVYESIRNLLFNLGLDRENFDKASWNPFGKIIKPGTSVLIKPNMVRHYNKVGGTIQLLTHGSIIRAMLDYVCIALKNQGQVTIGDAPVQNADFEKIVELVALDKVVDFCSRNSGITLQIVDFRTEKAYTGSLGNIVKREKLNGDPLGYATIDLNQDSELIDIIGASARFRVTQYNNEKMIQHHNSRKNEYIFPNSALNADVIINLPKLKSHRKAGMTCALKNLVGLNGCKDLLPHHRTGSLEEGGDEYALKSRRKALMRMTIEKIDNTSNKFALSMLRAVQLLIRISRLLVPYRDSFLEGSWYGNDTIGRMIADLNKIIFYADRNGNMTDKIQRKMFVLVDAVIAGEKEGPLEPSPKNAGVLAAGFNPVAVDQVCSRIMGFDPSKVPTLKYAAGSGKYPLIGADETIEIASENCQYLGDVHRVFNCAFKPSNGWQGHIEIEE